MSVTSSTLQINLYLMATKQQIHARYLQDPQEEGNKQYAIGSMKQVIGNRQYATNGIAHSVANWVYKINMILFDSTFICIGAPKLRLRLNSLAAGVFFLLKSDTLRL